MYIIIYIYIYVNLKNMITYKFIILCGRYRFFFLIVLPRFGHVFSNMGHKRKVPVFFLQSQLAYLPGKTKYFLLQL